MKSVIWTKFKLVQTRVIVNKVENKPFSSGLALAKSLINGDKPVSDNANFVNSNNPFFIRGGNYNNGTNAGVFNFNNNNGNSNSNNSFRMCLAIWYKKVSYICLRISIGYKYHTRFIPSFMVKI